MKIFSFAYKKYLILGIKIFISVFLLYLLYFKIDISGITVLLSSAKIHYILLALIFFLCGWFVVSIRWFLIVNSQGLKIKLSSLFQLNIISIFYSTILPGGPLTGDIAKCLLVVKNQENKVDLATSIIIDKIVHVASLGFFGALSLIASDVIFEGKFLLALNLISIFIAAIAIFIFAGFANRLFIYFSCNNLLTNVLEPIKMALIIIKSYKSNKKLELIMHIAFLSIIFQLFNTACIYFLSLSLYISISFADFIWINAVISILLFLPISYMGFGIREGGLIYLLSIFKISTDKTMSLSILIFIVSLIISFGGGLIVAGHYFKGDVCFAIKKKSI